MEVLKKKPHSTSIRGPSITASGRLESSNGETTFILAHLIAKDDSQSKERLRHKLGLMWVNLRMESSMGRESLSGKVG